MLLLFRSSPLLCVFEGREKKTPSPRTMPGFPSVVRSWPRSPGQLAADDKRSAHWHGSVARSDRAVYLPELVFFASLLLFLSVCLSRCWSLVVPAPVGWGPIARPAMTVQLPFTSVPSRVLWMMMIKCGLSLSSRAGWDGVVSVGFRALGEPEGGGVWFRRRTYQRLASPASQTELGGLRPRDG